MNAAGLAVDVCVWRQAGSLLCALLVCLLVPCLLCVCVFCVSVCFVLLLHASLPLSVPPPPSALPSSLPFLPHPAPAPFLPARTTMDEHGVLTATSSRPPSECRCRVRVMPRAHEREHLCESTT